MPFSSYFYIFGYLPNADYVSQNVSRQIILVMVILCYHLWFQIDFACPCSKERNFIHCYGYMVLPCVIITSIILWNDKRIGRIFRYSCYHASSKKKQCRGQFCFEFIMYILQATTSGFLWCGSVLIDGDWYVCCGSVFTEEFKILPCMTDSEMALTEKARKITLKNRSMVIHVSLILNISLVWKCQCVLN